MTDKAAITTYSSPVHPGAGSQALILRFDMEGITSPEELLRRRAARQAVRSYIAELRQAGIDPDICEALRGHLIESSGGSHGDSQTPN